MEALWTSVTSVITNFFTILGTTSTTLLSNSLFQIMLGIVILSLVTGFIFKLVRKLKRASR